MTTITNITNDQIRALRDEAREAGDSDMARDCELVLEWGRSTPEASDALDRIVEAIRDASAARS